MPFPGGRRGNRAAVYRRAGYDTALTEIQLRDCALYQIFLNSSLVTREAALAAVAIQCGGHRICGTWIATGPRIREAGAAADLPAFNCWI